MDPMLMKLLEAPAHPTEPLWLKYVPDQIGGVNLPFTVLLTELQAGEKRQTCRLLTGQTARIGTGTVLHFFTNWRTPEVQKLGSGHCTGRTAPLHVWEFTEAFAVADGFHTDDEHTARQNMQCWFWQTYTKRGNPLNMLFVGIRWIPLWLEAPPRVERSLDDWLGGHNHAKQN